MKNNTRLNFTRCASAYKEIRQFTRTQKYFLLFEKSATTFEGQRAFKIKLPFSIEVKLTSILTGRIIFEQLEENVSLVLD